MNRVEHFEISSPKSILGGSPNLLIFIWILESKKFDLGLEMALQTRNCNFLKIYVEGLKSKEINLNFWIKWVKIQILKSNRRGNFFPFLSSVRLHLLGCKYDFKNFTKMYAQKVC